MSGVVCVVRPGEVRWRLEEPKRSLEGTSWSNSARKGFHLNLCYGREEEVS